FEDESFWIETYPFMFSEKRFEAAVGEVEKILQRINAKFIIVGEGYLKDKLMKEAWDLGLGQRTYFTGFLSDKTVRYLYRAADVFVAPSLYEPFGIVALEAMAAKTPVVVSGVGGLSEIVEHEKTGVVVYPNNPDSLAWGIIRMLNNKMYSEKIRDNAFQMILNKYQWDNIASKTMNFYQGILEEYGKGQWKSTLEFPNNL
ncbi:MAG: glycosyltransferase family 4 protein, partial [Candidatus Bathyarchaeota archaeon]